MREHVEEAAQQVALLTSQICRATHLWRQKFVKVEHSLVDFVLVRVVFFIVINDLFASDIDFVVRNSFVVEARLASR